MILIALLSSCSRWTGIDGHGAPESIIDDRTGPEHCGWDDITFLDFGEETYVRDTEGEFDPEGDITGPYLAETELPPDATDTGYESADRHLYTAETEEAAFIVKGEIVERWPRLNVACA